MSTGYGWEGIRQVCATLLGAHHVPERLCGRFCLQRGAITSVRPLPFLLNTWPNQLNFNWSSTALKSSQKCLLTYKVEVAFTSKRVRDESNHLVQSDATINDNWWRWPRSHVTIHLSIHHPKRQRFVTDQRLVVTLTVCNVLLTMSTIG